MTECILRCFQSINSFQYHYDFIEIDMRLFYFIAELTIDSALSERSAETNIT